MGKTFYRPTDNSFQYKWSPEPFSKTTKKPRGLQLRKKKICTARPGTQDPDPVVKYVYQLVGGQHLAYVECDYVQ